MSEHQQLSGRFSWQAFVLWVGLTVMGYFLAMFLHFPSGFAVAPYDQQDITLGGAPFGFLFGAVSGLIIASLQWIVLKSTIPGARVWIPFNVLGYGLVHALGDTVSFPLFLVVSGIILGLAQYLALRHHLFRAILWFPIASIAWFSGFQLGLALPHQEGEYNLFLGALTYGMFTGLALKLLTAHREPVKQPEPA